MLCRCTDGGRPPASDAASASASAATATAQPQSEHRDGRASERQRQRQRLRLRLRQDRRPSDRDRDRQRPSQEDFRLSVHVKPLWGQQHTRSATHQGRAQDPLLSVAKHEYYVNRLRVSSIDYEFQVNQILFFFLRNLADLAHHAGQLDYLRSCVRLRSRCLEKPQETKTKTIFFLKNSNFVMC